MKKNTELFLAAGVVFLIFISLLVIFSTPSKEFSYEFVADEVLFVSNHANPGDQLRILGQKNSFMVVSEFLEKGSTAFMTQPITLFNSVLISQDKFVVTVAKTVGEQTGVILCDTNDGNKLVNRKMSASECDLFTENSERTLIMIKLPNSSLSNSRVQVFENSVLIEPNSFEDVSRVSFLVLKTMYSDSEEIISLINGLLNVISA